MDTSQVFGGEQRSVEPRPSAAIFVHADSVSLGELQCSTIRFEWFEVVAIVQAFCRAVFNTGDRIGPAKLAAADVRIDSSGHVRVTLRGGSNGEAAVRNVAAMALAMLPDHDVPAPFHLLLTQAHLFSSLEQFYVPLQQFERPNSALLIRQVYERWVNPDKNPAATLAAPPLAEASLEPDNIPTGRSRRVAFGYAAVGVFALIVGVVSVSLFRLYTPSVLSNPSQSIGSAAAAALTAADSATDKLLDRFLPSVVRVSAEPAASAAETASEPQPSTPVRRSRRVQTVFALVEAAARPRAADPAPIPVSPAAETMSAVRAENLAIADPSAIDSVTYSDTDVDVVPPVSIYPRFPTKRPTDVPIIEFDVVVSESGTVESVKALRMPATLGEALIATNSLSASKTWRFSAATKEGRPVKYRKVVWVPAQ